MTDAWSEIMKDAGSGVSGEYFVERDDGRVETMQVLDYVNTFDKWWEPEQLAMNHVSGKVLDIGCGAGRVALHLQNLGFSVVGTDLARGAIEACKKLGLEDARVMSADELDFPDSTFDTVILLGNNFGILGDEGKIVEMLQKLHRITTPDGIILAGSGDVVATDDKEHLMYHEMNVAKGRPKGFVRLRIKYKDIVDEWSDLRLAMPHEMESMANQAGWIMKKKYQSGVPYVGVLTKS
ncbi:MAG: class I SAM-dependent methyltransferase [Candidatus Thorarchaeota archaeon]